MNGSEAANQKTKGMAIVLGGSSGMGKTVAQHLLRDGIEVLITGLRVLRSSPTSPSVSREYLQGKDPTRSRSDSWH